MTWENIKSKGWPVLKKWWCSIILIPFVIYSVHQSYWVLHYNIFFAISYEFPFPINFIHFLLDNFLLIVHEAGHTFFGFLGNRTITILGGSLFQLLLPMMILAYTRFNNMKIGMQLALYMLGFSFMDVAFYAADAGARQLPLIGGLTKEAHDWYNLLSRWGLLGSDLTIAVCIAALGVLCYLAALLVPWWYQDYEEKNLNLELET